MDLTIAKNHVIFNPFFSPKVNKGRGEMVRIMRHVTERIEELRKERGIKKKDVGKACSKTGAWYTKIIKNELELKVADLLAISNLFKVKVEDLLPVPKTLDVSEMSMIDLIRMICKEEIQNYLKEEK